jgi:hypothetical protein
VRQAFPAAADANDFTIDFAGAIDHCLDDRVETRNIAAAGEDADTLRGHE